MASLAAAGNIMLSGGAAPKGRGAAVAAVKKAPKARGSSVCYLGHLPHGFYEEQIRGYFEQYGEVRRIRVSRSKKTARSRGFAFIDFAG
jgi:nucleolar protein 15